MFETLKQQENLKSLIAKLDQIETKINELNKLLKEKQKPVKNENTGSK